jgi:D-xylose transport system substrate-binding protein
MKYYRYLIVATLLFAMISCSESNKVKVGFLGNDSNELALQNQNNFIQRAQQLGAEVLDDNAEGDEDLQYKQALELMDKGVKVLVLSSVNSISAAAIVREAHIQDVIVIAYDRIVKNCDLDYYVTFDSRKVGEYMALEALKQKSTGNYVLFWGDKSDDNADLVKAGVMKVLQPQIDNGNIKVLYKIYVDDWSGVNAEYEMDRVVRLTSETPIDAVVTSYDGLARGAISVLKKYNMLEGVFVSGQNAETQSLKMILNGEQSISVYKSPKKLGYSVAELAVKLASKSDEELNFSVNDSVYNGRINVPSILFDPVVITNSNMEEKLFSDGLVKREDLNN